MRAVLVLIFALAIQSGPWTPTAHAQAPCRFVLGFAALRDLVGVQKVGDCLDDERFNLENGNAEQRTSGGLLVWRKADNFTAFTDGGTSWVNGPNGLQSRPNRERFSWEKDPVASVPDAAPSPTAATVNTAPLPTAAPIPTVMPQPPVTAAQPTSVPLARATPTVAPAKLTGALKNRCTSILTDVTVATGVAPPTDLLRQCWELGEQYGAPGVDCFDDALKFGVQAARRVGRGAGNIVGQVVADRLNTCLSDFR